MCACVSESVLYVCVCACGCMLVCVCVIEFVSAVTDVVTLTIETQQ